MEANVLLNRDNMKHFDQPEQQLIQQIQGRLKNKVSSLLLLATSVLQGFDPIYSSEMQHRLKKCCLCDCGDIF